ncbi:MAG: sigma-70 family RNA polymerase sigma factor [bacterium]|nr:sigma-70 family RNA polymerase sigma factor [bacterium]
MSETENRETPEEPQVNWEQARGFLSRRLARKLFREDHATLDDLTQEALVRVLRAARRDTVHNLEGLMETIAERTVVDFLRSRRITRDGPTVDPHEQPDHPGLAFSPEDHPVPCLERLRFTVLEFFQENNSGCLELARHYFANRDWLVVAQDLGRPHTAVRQQWSRCRALLRASARKDASWGWEWV